MSAKTDEDEATGTNGAAQLGAVKRLSSEDVKRSDGIRDAAERETGKRGPGRPKGSSTKSKSPEDAAKAARERTQKEKEKKAAKDEYREPSAAELKIMRRMLEISNRPLFALERVVHLQAMALELDPEFVLKSGDLPMSPVEIEFFTECGAGTIALLGPYLKYLPPIGLAVGGVAFCVTRAITLAGSKSILTEVAKARGLTPEQVDQKAKDLAKSQAPVGSPENPKPAEGVKVT